MKKIVFGLIIGLFLSLGFTTFAAIELNVIPNPFPVLINGVETAVEGYNINGYTFLKLADFKKAGLTVKFNETDKQIEITSADSSTAAPQVQQNNISGGSNMITQTPDGLPVFQYEGKDYVKWSDLRKMCEIKGYKFNTQNNQFNIENQDNSSVCSLNLVTTYDPYNAVNYDDYVNVALPLLK